MGAVKKNNHFNSDLFLSGWNISVELRYSSEYPPLTITPSLLFFSLTVEQEWRYLQWNTFGV